MVGLKGKKKYGEEKEALRSREVGSCLALPNAVQESGGKGWGPEEHKMGFMDYIIFGCEMGCEVASCQALVGIDHAILIVCLILQQIHEQSIHRCA
jgi:hypothetical protein